MSNNKSNLWYSVCGVLMIILGIFAFIFPSISAVWATVVIGILLIVAGVLSLVAGYHLKEKLAAHIGWLICEAIMDILLGILLLVQPVGGSVVFGYMMIFFFLASSILSIYYAIQVRTLGIKSWAWLLVLGILGIILAFILLFSSSAFEMSMLVGTVAGFYLVFDGVRLISAGIGQ